MKRLLTILGLFYAVVCSSQTTNFSFTPLTGTYQRWGVGNDQWNEQSVGSGQSVSGYHEPTVYYRRFTVPEIIDENGNFYWSRFDARINAAIEAHKKFAFGIFSMYAWPESDNFFNITPTMTGIDQRTGQSRTARSAVPLEWHNAMQAGGTKNWVGESGDWIPNYNSSAYLTRTAAMFVAINNHLNTTTYTPSWSASPITYKDVIQYIDIRMFGTWGEWHSYGSAPGNNVANYPSGTFPTVATFKAIIDAHVDNMPNYRFVCINNIYDGGRLGNIGIPAEVGVYALTKQSNKGFIGCRNDHMGEITGYDDFQLYDNPYSFGGFRMDTAQQYRHRLAPRVGEPPGGPVYYNGVVQGALPGQIRKWRHASVGNGNYGQGNVPTGAGADSVRLAYHLAGYHLRLTGGNATVATNFTINLNWQNFGLTPTYDRWTVEYSLRNGAGTTVWTANSSFDPYLFAAEQGNQTKTDIYAKPALAAGTYGLYIRVKDPVNYMTPLQLQITGRDANGSYFLGNINFGAGPTNQPPTVNAGNNQSITASSTSVTATASDPDGSIASYQWSRVSGPNTPTIVSPTSANTNITGLIAGTYVFNITVADNNGATASDDVQITVQPNAPPVANAGSNKVISLPTTTTSLTGSGSDDIAVVAYQWSMVSGPTPITFSSPTTANTNVSNLTVAGVYTVRLTVTDGSGLTGTDDATITVNAGNQPPIANAGPDQTIQQPTAIANLSGSLSTDEGVLTYLWTQVGGDITTTISTPTSVTTTVTGLSQIGFYIYRLRVTDAQGLSTTDDVQVQIVAAGNIAPVAAAGPNVTLTLPTNFTQLNGTGSTDNIGIVSYLWTKQSGPATFSISAPNNAITNIESLQLGVYVFRLTVTDGGGLSSFDDVTVTVLPAANAAPIANGGGNKSITLPTTTTSFDGSASTDDVGIVNYLWTQVSGPATATIATPGASTTNISGLTIAGTYLFRLRVEDAGSLFDTDDVTVTVNPAANNAPVSIITTGTPSIQLPTNSINLSGTSSTDDVAIVGYVFFQYSGPSQATIATPTASSTNITNLVAGIYFFKLQVTDGGGLQDTDMIQITVLPATPSRPILNNHSLIKGGLKFLPRNY